MMVLKKILKKKFKYNLIVGFEETNLVGNVYFSNYIKWQGKCREMFLCKRVPEILKEIQFKQLALITLKTSCSHIGELNAFDEVIIEMSLKEIHGGRVKMNFEYFKKTINGSDLVAEGSHEIGCYRRNENGLTSVNIPEPLKNALQEYK